MEVEDDSRQYDNSVLKDAVGMLRAAAYRLNKASLMSPERSERNKLIGEARAILYGVEARIK